MKISRRTRLEAGLLWLLAALCILTMPHAQADVSLSSDWQSRYSANGQRVPDAEHEIPRLDQAVAAAAGAHAGSLRRGHPTEKQFEVALSFKLRIDGKPHYLAPVMLMSKRHPADICTPEDYSGSPTYRCVEGQRYTHDCHVFIFNDRFEEVGYHRIGIDEKFPFFCNAVPAVGVGNKALNELLLTVQYFPIDRKAASKVSDLGSGWIRMTVPLRVAQANDGRVQITQDDTCLGNPNRIETIPEARKALSKCTAAKSPAASSAGAIRHRGK